MRKRKEGGYPAQDTPQSAYKGKKLLYFLKIRIAGTGREESHLIDPCKPQNQAYTPCNRAS